VVLFERTIKQYKGEVTGAPWHLKKGGVGMREGGERGRIFLHLKNT